MNLFTMSWQQGWEIVGWTMCYFLAAGTLVALLGTVVRYAFRRAVPQIRYVLSLVVFATLAMLPFAIAGWLLQSLPAQLIRIDPPSIVVPPQAASQSPQVIDLKEQSFQQLVLPPNDVEPLPEAEIPVQYGEALHQDGGVMDGIDTAIEFLPWVWIIGTPLTFALLATGLIGSERLRKKSKRLIEGPVYDACQRLSASLAVSRQVGIAINERIASPLLVGIVRPLILLPPAALTGWSPDELEMVLLHELAHVRRWDNLANFLQRIVESLLFFHPAVWWVSRWVRSDREECCDAVVIAHTAKPQAYAELLVTLASGTTPLAGLAMAQHPLAGRIRRILKLEDEKMLVSRGTLGWLGLALVAVLAVVLWQPTTTLVAEETNQTVVAGKEELTTEDTESTEEKKNNKDKERVVLSIDVNTPVSKINKIIKQYELTGKNISLKANNDGTMTLTTIRENKPPTVISAKRITFDGDQIKLEGITRAQANSPFLSLEDQRAADLAYKLLGLELEPLSQEELQRVKKLGHEGGLRVVQTVGFAKGEGVPANASYPNDLLVGLHIWPIKSLQDIANLLERDDLSELSPMKFYAVRSAAVGFGRGRSNGEPYKLVTGRIKVNRRTASPLNTALNPALLAPGDRVKVVATGVYPDQPIDDVYKIELSGTLPLGPTYGRVQVAGKTLLEAETAVKKELLKILRDVGVQITLVEKAKAKKSSATEPALLSYTRKAESASQQKARLKRELLIAKARLQVAHANQERKLAANQVQPGAVSKLDLQESQAAIQRAELLVQRSEVLLNDHSKKQPTTLLYDNKTFDQWRSQWKNELKTEKRTEAIRAMAAFGRAGYGKEAAEAILDVAGEYDFRNWESGDKAVQSLKSAIIKALADHGGLDADIWAPLLIDRWESDQSRWRGLAGNLLARAYEVKPELLQRLLDIAVNPKNSVGIRAAALRAVGNNDYKLEKPTTVELMRSAFDGKEPEMIIQALNVTNLRHLDKLPEQLALFFHPSEKVRRDAAISIVGAGTENGRRVVHHLLNILDDPGRAADHLHVVEAISWNVTRSNTFNDGLRDMKADLIERLRHMLIDGDKTLLPEAIRALSKLTAVANEIVIQNVNNLEISEQRKKELEKAVEVLDGSPVNGGGMGGGGGGGFF